MKGGRYLRIAGRVVAVVGAVIAVLAVRVVTASQAELAEGDRLRAVDEVDAAIPHYRRAAGWYAPGNPYCEQALDRLLVIGGQAQEAGDSARALLAFRAVRAGIMSSRSVFTPHGARLERANEAIAANMAAEPPAPIDAGRSEDERRREMLEMLESSERPGVLWSLVLLFGFLTWVGSAFLFSMRAFDEEDRLVAPAARRWGTAFIVGFGLFVLGMLLA